MKKLLIIEDDKFLVSLLGKRMEKEGIDFEIAATGEEGLKKVYAQKPDLISLDLVLPGIDGYEVLEKIKTDPLVAGIPVFVLSNLGQKAEKEKALNLGAEAFFVKAEHHLDELVEKIKRRLEQ